MAKVIPKTNAKLTEDWRKSVAQDNTKNTPLRLTKDPAVNTTNEFLLDKKSMRSKVNPAANPALINESPEFDILTGVGGVVKSGAYKSAYKINPLAFKPNSQAYYRGIGKSGFDDAIESGLIRTPKKSPYGKDIYMSSDINIAKEYSKNSRPTKWINKGDGSFSIIDDPIIPKGFDGKGYIAEIPRAKLLNPNDPKLWNVDGRYNFHQFVNKEDIPIDGVNFLKENWLTGYKKVKPKTNITK